MRQLEERVGATLVQRTTRRVELTPAGWRLVPRPGIDQRRAEELLLRDLDALYDDTNADLQKLRPELETARQSVKELRDGDIFLVGFGEELLVKRVQRTPRGWLLKSENRDFSDIVVEGPDLETFRVYGRVRWFGRVV